MKIERLVVGQLRTNCYLVWEEGNREALIIDPGDAGDYIIRRIRDLELTPELIVATHGHIDHVLAVTELKLAFGIPFWINKKDLFLVKRMRSSAQHWLGIEADPAPEADQFIKEGDLVEFGQEKLKVIETPGHSPGGVAFYGKCQEPRSSSGEPRERSRIEPVRTIRDRGSTYLGGKARPILFSGDTLFRQGVGRTDFSYGSEEELIRSIKKLFKLPEQTLVYPGHGEQTTIGEEGIRGN